MNRFALTLVVPLGLLAPSVVLAHDPALHKGKATVGEIVSHGSAIRKSFRVRASTGD